MSNFKYKNVSDNTQAITASGAIEPRVVEPGQEVISDVVIENPNFEYVGESAAVEPTPEVEPTNQEETN